MKNVIIVTLIATMAVAFAPKADAGDKERALIGGIIGGLIIGEILDDDHRGHSSVHVSYGSHGYGHSRHGGGYYRYETYKRWVPGGYSWRYDDCGVRYRHYYRGYYTYDKRKVWVPNRYSGKGHYYRDHRDYGRGNNHYDRHDRRDRYDDRDNRYRRR